MVDPGLFPAGAAPLEDIVITGVLDTRPSRSEDHAGENRALRQLTRALRSSPEEALRELCEQALVLCRAESAGISMAEMEGGNAIFRWHATAGGLAPFRDATMPRYFSPCGVVVDTKSVQLMDRMVRHFAYVEKLGIHLQEVLLVPFFRGDVAVGTIWVVGHSESARFDREDCRLLQSLADATSAIVDSYLKQRELEQARARLLDNERHLQGSIVSAQRNIQELRHERELRENFVAMLTHDLRTPLGTAKLALDLIQNGAVSEAVQGYAGRGVRALDRIEKMVTDMLDAAQERAAGRAAPSMERCDLRTFLLQTVDGFNLADAGRVRLQLPAQTIECNWEASSIRRVIENLVSNGIKYGAPDQPVTISAAPLDDGVALRVHNVGNPIPAGARQALFQAYSRADGARKQGEQSWGLGLALVKAVTEAHGGRVEVTSSAAEGTAFSVWLPVAGSSSALQ